MITKDNYATVEELYAYLDKILCGRRGWIIKPSGPYNKGACLLASDGETIILRASSNKRLLTRMKIAKHLLYKHPERLIRRQSGALGIVQPKYEGLI